MTPAEFLQKWSTSTPTDGAAAQAVADDVARGEATDETSAAMPGQPSKTVDDFRREKLMQMLGGPRG